MTGPGALTVQVGAGNAVSVDATGLYSFPNLQLGSYQPVVTVGGSQLGQGASTPVTVGAMAPADMDLTAGAGIATGVITVNGQPFPVDRITVDVNGTSCSFSTNAGAGFTMLLPPGSYTATPRSPATGTTIGTFPFTVQAGQTTSLGTLAFDTGAIQGYVLFNGAPAPALAFAGSGALTVQAGAGITASVDANGFYSFPNLPVGTYHPVVMVGASPLGPAATTPVTAGGTAVEYLDLTSSVGLATGLITANGQPLAVDRIPVVGTGTSCVFSTSAGAHFQMLLPPGSYTATPRSPATGATIGTFPFTVTAGATTNLGTLAFDTGAIQGYVLFNGAPVPALAMAGLGALTVQAGAGITATVDATGFYSFPNLPVGTYPLALMHGAVQLVQGAMTTVTNGGTATAYLGVTSSAGLATGVITVNGQPFPVDRIVVDGNATTSVFSSDANARFAMLLPPGSYTATPRSPATGASIGTFDFTVAAGATNAVLAVPVGAAIAAFALSPVSPNPTTGHSLVTFAVPRRSHVRLTLLDVQGREVAVLADGVRDAGRYTAALQSGGLQAGVYFVRMQAPGGQLTRRLEIVR